jgi:hypothetical protein|nr:nuclear transport factor 2 family protein [Serratia fonticola]
MTDDHVFIDAYGNRENKEAMSKGWTAYFSWFPDYLLIVSALLLWKRQHGTLSPEDATLKSAQAK